MRIAVLAVAAVLLATAAVVRAPGLPDASPGHPPSVQPLTRPSAGAPAHPAVTVSSLPTAAPAPARVYRKPQNRVPWLGGRWYLHGANYPWHSYGADFGYNPWSPGVHDPAARAEVEADFARIQADGLHEVRWFMFTDGRAGIVFGADGNPTGLDQWVFPDLDAAVAIAAAHDVYLDLVFLDFTFVKDAQLYPPVQVGGRGGVIASAAGRSALVDNVFTPVIRHLAANPYVMAYEAMNEPEWAVATEGHATEVAHPLALGAMQDLVARTSAAVHANSQALSTLGNADIKWVGDYRGAGLDLYQAHYYSWMASLPPDNLYAMDAAGLALDRPLVVGEFAPGDAAAYAASLSNWWLKGFAGDLAWSVRAGGAGQTIDPGVSQAFAANHASAVAITPYPARSGGCLGPYC